MKKDRGIAVLAAFLIIIMAVIYIVWNWPVGDVSHVNRIVGTSVIYSAADINDAMEVVERCFRRTFSGCTLTDLWYDEADSLLEADRLAAQYNADEVIVLESNFDVDASGGDGSLTPNSTYHNWNLILTRNKGGRWRLRTRGYG